MPQLVVNLNDVQDCRQAIGMLRHRLGPGAANGPVGKSDAGQNTAAGNGGGNGSTNQPNGKQADMPIKQRFRIISQRGVWKHLVNIAQCDDKPRSLPEWDDHLGLPKNKLRSLKGNFAKLENRFNLCFLRVADQAVPDENNNPRYIMPPRIRNQILGVVEESAETA